jgi:hypothetical protein
MGASTRWKIPIKICLTLSGTVKAIVGPYKLMYFNARSARLQNDLYQKLS